jgi:hypothetical protein
LKKIFFTCIILLSLLAAISAEQKSILVESTPPGASVYWGGKKLGTTPLAITPDTPGAPGFFKAGSPSFDLYLS